MNRAVLLVIPALLLAACDRSGIVGPKAARPAPSDGPEPPSILSPQGWGPVRVGMSEDKAIEAMGEVRPAGDQPDPACHYLRPVSADSIFVMIQSGKVARVEARAGANAIPTDKGVKVGAEVGDVIAQYPGDLEVEPSKYEPPPAQYLTSWNRRDRQGVRYVIDADGKVSQILAGGPAIRLVEGCS